MGGNQSQHSPMARPHPFSAINRRAFDATISKATLSPPLPGLITRNSLHEFLNVALRFPEHSALRDVQRDYERELRALNVLTLNDVLDAQDSTIDQVFRRNKSYKSRVQDAIGVAKSLFPVCNDVIVQDSVVENSMTWRVSSVEVKTSLYTGVWSRNAQLPVHRSLSKRGGCTSGSKRAIRDQTRCPLVHTCV